MSYMTNMRNAAAAKWAAAKPVCIGLMIGLVAGPIISGFSGFQVRTSTAQAATRASVVDLQAQFCTERARAATGGAPATNWQARTELAQRWASMPGSTTIDQEVVYACSSALGR